ncbi:unnamed protein product [Heterobilharzia americana]|nr:unnamed protein product [Heterobilharzia americana]
MCFLAVTPNGLATYPDILSGDLPSSMLIVPLTILRAYGELSCELTTTSDVRQGCPPSPSPFNFVIDVSMDITLEMPDFAGIDQLPVVRLVDFEYADDTVLLGEEADKMQGLLKAWSRNLSMFGCYAFRTRQM